jgi:hypothetical protein
MQRNAQVSVDNASALLGAELALLDLSIQVANAYNLAVDLTTLAASMIEPALGRVGLTSTTNDDKPAISNALVDYVRSTKWTPTCGPHSPLRRWGWPSSPAS